MAKEVFRGEIGELVQRGAELVDVREDGQDDGLTPGDRHVPLSRLSELADTIAKDRPTVFYCRSGVFSFQAAQIAASWTTAPVYYLAGGLLGSAAFADA
jgi:rhodanese-related sulfurtransferase